MALPPSSPRLPSPPPPTEIHLGPKSPSLSGSMSLEPTIEQSIIDANAKRRIHPGTRSADMAAGPPLVPLNELDSAFQLQEHLKALHYYYSKPPNSDHTVPISRDSAILIASQPEGVDRALWLYELCRFLINKCNDLIIGFLFDDPPCSATTCPEMRASEWQFLCAVHESPKSCCAIDYCCHTLDWATNIVTSQKIFPSRLSLGAGDSVDERGAGVKHLTNIFRRLHRIFAHAWFQHRGVFWQVEGQTGLYVLFKTVCDTYDLLPAENYKLPPEAEGLEPAEEIRAAIPSIMKSTPHTSNGLLNDDDASRQKTRRHIRQSPSVGSAVTTVLEADEEEADVTQRLDDLQLTEEETATETQAETPVIVESYEVEDSDDEQLEPLSTEDKKNSLPKELFIPAETVDSLLSQDEADSEVTEKPKVQEAEDDKAEEKKTEEKKTEEKKTEEKKTEEKKTEEESAVEISDEAQEEALISQVAVEEEKPAPEEAVVEKLPAKEAKKDHEEKKEDETKEAAPKSEGKKHAEKKDAGKEVSKEKVDEEKVNEL